MNKRRRILLPVLAMALLLILVACDTGGNEGTDAPVGTETGTATETATEETVTEEATEAQETEAQAPSGGADDAASLLDRMAEAIAAVESVRGKLYTDSQMYGVDENGERVETEESAGGIAIDFDSKSEIEYAWMKDPETAYTRISYDAENDMSNVLEEYIYDGSVYSNQFEGRWMKMLDTDAGEQARSIRELYLSPQTIDVLRNIQDHIHVTDEGDTYRLEFEGEGAAAQELMEKMSQGQPEPEFDVESEIHHMKYVYIVDKQDYRLRSILTEMDAITETSMGRMRSISNTQGEFSEYNAVNIQVPQEVLDAPEY